jgi:predicted secreted protein
MELKLGYECKLYVSATASTAPSASSSEMANIKDVTVTLNRTAVDATTRAAGAFKTYVPGQIDSEISFKMLADGDSSSNTLCTAIRNAWINGSALAMKIELGDGYFFMADFIVTDMSNGQSLEDVVSYDIKVKPTLKDSAFKPTFGQES